MSISAEYGEFVAHLHTARAALNRADRALDLIGPADHQWHVVLDDLIVGIQMSADLVGQRTGANERDRAARSGRACPLGPDDVLGRLDAELEAGTGSAGAGPGTRPADRLQAALHEIALALDRRLDADVRDQVTRVARSVLNLATRLPAAGQ